MKLTKEIFERLRDLVFEILKIKKLRRKKHPSKIFKKDI